MRNKAVLLFFTLFASLAGIAGIKVQNANKIITDYHENAVKADSLYKSRRIIVSGKVSAVFRDKDSRLCVEMRSGKGRSFPALFMYFEDKYAEEVLVLKKGEDTSIETTCRGAGRINHKKIFCEESRVVSGSGHSVATGNDKSVSSVITIEGKKGNGTGFIAMFHGRKVLITNTHVLFGNFGLKFLDMDNERLKISKIRFARDRDIAILDVVDCKAPPLVITGDINGSFIDQKVYVYGNTKGAGVNNRVVGKIIGVGPVLIELEAEGDGLVNGNSGSPVLVGKRVAGVYTFDLVPSRISLLKVLVTNKTGIRKFAHRVDNIRDDDLQLYDKRTFSKDKKVYNQVTRSVNMLGAFLNHRWRMKQLQDERDINKFRELQTFADKWNIAVTTYVRYTSDPKYKTLASTNPFKQQLAKFRLDLVRTMDKSSKYRFRYNYINNCVKEEQKKFRTLLEVFDDRCDKIIKSHDSDPLKSVREENKHGRNNTLSIR